MVSALLVTFLVIGSVEPVRAPMCSTQADAEAVVKADQEGGIPAAIKVLQENPNCGVGEAYLLLNRVVFVAKTDGRTVRVVEAELNTGNSRHRLYMITDIEVRERPRA